jgi:hypothetical protein
MVYFVKEFFMKKIVLLLLVFAVVGGSAFAFDILSFPPPLEGGGSVMIDAGIGLRYLSLASHKMTMPPLFLNVEYALPVGVPISVGLGLAVGQWKYNNLVYSYLGYDYGYKVTYITPYVRANWHWGFDISWLDFYTGLGFGVDIAAVKWNDDLSRNYLNKPSNYFYYAFQAGAHFYFSKYVGAVVETGFPYYIKAGIALKFGGKGGSSSGSSE